jgi:hypothetical protein
LGITFDLRDGSVSVPQVQEFIEKEAECNGFHAELLQDWKYGMASLVFRIQIVRVRKDEADNHTGRGSGKDSGKTGKGGAKTGKGSGKTGKGSGKAILNRQRSNVNQRCNDNVNDNTSNGSTQSSNGSTQKTSTGSKKRLADLNQAMAWNWVSQWMVSLKCAPEVHSLLERDCEEKWTDYLSRLLECIRVEMRKLELREYKSKLIETEDGRKEVVAIEVDPGYDQPRQDIIVDEHGHGYIPYSNEDKAEFQCLKSELGSGFEEVDVHEVNGVWWNDRTGYLRKISRDFFEKKISAKFSTRRNLKNVEWG